MVEETQNFPLSHYQNDNQKNEELMKALEKERTNKCFIYVFSISVFLGVTVLIFALIVLHVISPKIKFSSISVNSLSYGNTNSPSPSFNLTLAAEVVVDNLNFLPFDIENGTVGFVHGGVIVGKRSMSACKVKAKGSKRINVNVEVRSSNGLLDSKNVSSDLSSGILKMRSFAKLRGRVRFIYIFKKRKMVEVDCSFGINFRTRQIQDLFCI